MIAAGQNKNDSIKYKSHVYFHFILEKRLQITLFQAFNSYLALNFSFRIHELKLMYENI